MKNEQQTLECHACAGAGRVPIPDHFKQILKLLKTHPGSTAEFIQKKQTDDVSVNAVSNRLSEMLKVNLVTRRRVGKFFHYSLSK